MPIDLLSSVWMVFYGTSQFTLELFWFLPININIVHFVKREMGEGYAAVELGASVLFYFR